MPKKITKAQLIELIADMIQMVGADDSFEGRIEYTCMAEGCGPDEFMVSAVMRVGNLMGQGGVIIVEADES